MINSIELPINATNSFSTEDISLFGVDGAVCEMRSDGTIRELRRFSGATRGIRSLFVSAKGSLFASPEGLSLDDSEKGLWRTFGAYGSWGRVISLSGRPNPICLWSLAEDSIGRLFAGVYTTAPNERSAEIWSSSDDGVTWTIIYSDLSARHIHDIAVDLTNDAIYASLGDDFGIWAARRVIRSQDNGDSWQPLLEEMPQVLPILPIPGARLFGSDCPGGARIFRTFDDQTFETVLHDEDPLYFFWMRQNKENGSLFASAVRGKQYAYEAKIYLSTDQGSSWHVVSRLISETKSDGSSHAGNMQNGRMLVHIRKAGKAQPSVVWNCG